MSFLVLDRLTKRFGSFPAVDSLSLAVEKGELVALLGPSGCGKTTTLQMIAGFVRPTSGSIALEGRDLLRVRPAARGLGIVFQSYALFPHMTAAENVAFGLEMRGISREERAVRVRQMLDLVGLGTFSDRLPRHLSGGQQQRVALARALVIKPRILLLDEPLSNLDAKLKEEMQIELRQIQRTLATTTLMVTHDQSEAMALADRMVIMNAGRVEQIAAPHEAYDRPQSSFVATFLGRSNVLAAVLEGDGAACCVRIGDGRWPLPPGGAQGAQGAPRRVTVRPERIAFAAPQQLPEQLPQHLGGTVRARVFQGNHWLYQVDTAAGVVTVVRQNSGEAAPVEGDAVRLSWRVEDMVVAAAEQAS
jgi:putative spermidine/putrescine transport system ATP-binding protein